MCRRALVVALPVVVGSAALLLAQAPPPLPSPEATEVWTPVPRVVTPGPMVAHRSAHGRHRPLRWHQPRRVGERRRRIARHMAGARRRDSRPQAEPATSGPGARSPVTSCTWNGVCRRASKAAARPAVTAGCSWPRREGRRRLRAADSRFVRERHLRQRPGRQHLQAGAAAGERDPPARRVECLRRGVDCAGLQRRRHAAVAGRGDRLPQRRAGPDGFRLRGATVFRGEPTYTAHGPSPLKLQAHNDPSAPIAFRNIWLRPLGDSLAASR